MCDYSLHDVLSRKAKEGDDLQIGKFGQHRVTGFGRPEDGATCVTCVPHGTKLAVTTYDGRTREAIFGLNDKGMWRDGLNFADDPTNVVSLQSLPLGITAKVVALPLAKTPAPQPGMLARAIGLLAGPRQPENVR